MSESNNPAQKKAADLMRDMRIKVLTAKADAMGIKPTRQYPRVFAALMDWPLGSNIISVFGAVTGDASLYTTSTFGVIGGIGHEPVRAAAKEFVRIAEIHHDDAVITNEYPYPKEGRIYFYLVCFDGVRMIDADAGTIPANGSKFFDLGGAAQSLITQLRLISGPPGGQPRPGQ